MLKMFYLNITSLVFTVLNMVFGSLSSLGHAGERLHFFNLSSFGREERMVKAEFRWFRKKQKVYLGKFYAPHFCKVSCSVPSITSFQRGTLTAITPMNRCDGCQSNLTHLR